MKSGSLSTVTVGAPAMPHQSILFFILLVWKVILGEGKDRSWSWSLPSQPLTDEEIVDLLYTDPDRLRALSLDAYDGGLTSFDVPQTIDFRPNVPVSIIESSRLPNNGDNFDTNLYPDEQIPSDSAKPLATSYMRIEHLSPKSDSMRIISYSHRIIH